MGKRREFLLFAVLLLAVAGCADRVLPGPADPAAGTAPDSSSPPAPSSGDPAPAPPAAADYLPLVPGSTMVYEGSGREGLERTEITVVPGTFTVAGAGATVVVRSDFLDGTLRTQVRSFVVREASGDLRVLREDVREFADGRVVSTDGSFEAGVLGAAPALLLPGSPRPGDEHRLRDGTGPDGVRMEIVSLDAPVALLDGRTLSALKTREWDPNVPDGAEYRWYAPGVGLVREERADGGGWSELVESRVSRIAARAPWPVDDPAPNPLFPLVPGTRFVYEGDTEEGFFRAEVFVARETKVIAGVPCAVVEVTETLDGELAERTTEWFATNSAGDVWYMGEATAEYENGEVVTTDGSWEAGIDGAEPGLLLPANPTPGDTFPLERAAGVAEDRAEVIAVDVPLLLSDGTAHLAVEVKEWDPNDPEEVDYKYYAAGVGLVRDAAEDGSRTIDLVRVSSE